MILVTTAYLESHHAMRLNTAYLNALRAVGLTPVAYYGGNRREFAQLARACDALMLSGGGDIAPERFGAQPHPKTADILPERDAFEIDLCKRFYAMHKPILGICRGMQLLNVALGGTLWQDIGDECGVDHPRNGQAHDVLLEKGSLLERAMGMERIRVNSFHHQAVRQPGGGLRVCAQTPDGLIEAVEAEEGFALGVQWHPERDYAADRCAKEVFAAFANAVFG